MSQKISPFPTKTNLLKRLREVGIPISEIVDVGVREKTGELIEVFPDKRHHLFEPVLSFFPDIKKNYAGIDHELYPIALSNENREMYLVQSCLSRDGIVTHSVISNEPVEIDGKLVVLCDKLVTQKFYNLNIELKKNFLLKVDVDGQDLNVVKGFGARLEEASAVIIEATYMNFAERLSYLVQNNFQLYDIVDLVYYGSGLYQCDIAFIRTDYVNDVSRPDINSEFKNDYWRPIN